MAITTDDLMWNYLKRLIQIHYQIEIMEYLEGTMETLVFDILICWKCLGIKHKQVLLLNAALMCSVMGAKYNFESTKFKIHNRLFRKVSFLTPRS